MGKTVFRIQPLGLGAWTLPARFVGMVLFLSAKEVQVEVGGGLTLCLRFSGKSDLTVDAVKLHNELQSGSLRLGKSEAPETAMEEEATALTEKSSATFLSGLSDCTNVTFSKVQRFWESNSAAHKEVVGRVRRAWGSEEGPDSCLFQRGPTAVGDSSWYFWRMHHLSYPLCPLLILLPLLGQIPLFSFSDIFPAQV